MILLKSTTLGLPNKPLEHTRSETIATPVNEPRSPIPMRAPRATAILKRTELLAVILYIQLYTPYTRVYPGLHQCVYYTKHKHVFSWHLTVPQATSLPAHHLDFARSRCSNVTSRSVGLPIKNTFHKLIFLQSQLGCFIH